MSVAAEAAAAPDRDGSTAFLGSTFLHQEALAGSNATVNVLLQAGANPNAVTNHGMTALQLAKSLGWDKVVALLVSKGAT